jgi:hypothetical protein
MKDGSRRKNGHLLTLETSEHGGSLGVIDAASIRRACDAWLRKNDPNWVEHSSFNFGSLKQGRRREAA